MPSPQNVDWRELKVEFVNGSMQFAELARKHGIKAGTIRQRAFREGWQAERDAASVRVTEAAQAQLTEVRIDALREFNEADLRVARALRAMVARRIAAARNDEGMRATDLRALAGTAAEAQKIGRLALGISTENHGHGGPNGQGPVPLADVHPEAYRQALQDALKAF